MITISAWLVCLELASDDQTEWMVSFCFIWTNSHAALLALVPQVHFLKLSSRVSIYLHTVCVWVEFDFALLP